jgi:hypothetical protein
MTTFTRKGHHLTIPWAALLWHPKPKRTLPRLQGARASWKKMLSAMRYSCSWLRNVQDLNWLFEGARKRPLSTPPTSKREVPTQVQHPSVTYYSKSSNYGTKTMVMIISVLSATGVQNELQRGCMKRSRNLSISTAGSSSNRHHVSGTMGSYVWAGYEKRSTQRVTDGTHYWLVANMYHITTTASSKSNHPSCTVTIHNNSYVPLYLRTLSFTVVWRQASPLFDVFQKNSDFSSVQTLHCLTPTLMLGLSLFRRFFHGDVVTFSPWVFIESSLC